MPQVLLLCRCPNPVACSYPGRTNDLRAFAKGLACHKKVYNADGSTTWQSVPECQTSLLANELSRAVETTPSASQLQEFRALTDSYPQCAAGYTGLLCGQCSPGYGKGSVPFSCSQCPNAGSMAFVLALGFVSVMGVLLYTIRAAIVSPMTSAQLRSQQQRFRWRPPALKWHRALRKSLAQAMRSRPSLQPGIVRGGQQSQHRRQPLQSTLKQPRAKAVAEGSLSQLDAMSHDLEPSADDATAASEPSYQQSSCVDTSDRADNGRQIVLQGGPRRLVPIRETPDMARKRTDLKCPSRSLNPLTSSNIGLQAGAIVPASCVFLHSCCPVHTSPYRYNRSCTTTVQVQAAPRAHAFPDRSTLPKSALPLHSWASHQRSPVCRARRLCSHHTACMRQSAGRAVVEVCESSTESEESRRSPGWCSIVWKLAYH
jgi:hypothetical protein